MSPDVPAGRLCWETSQVKSNHLGHQNRRHYRYRCRQAKLIFQYASNTGVARVRIVGLGFLQFPANRGCRVADFADSSCELPLADAELAGPIVDIARFEQVDPLVVAGPTLPVRIDQLTIRLNGKHRVLLQADPQHLLDLASRHSVWRG